MRGLLAMRGMKRRVCWNCVEPCHYTPFHSFFSLLSGAAGERLGAHSYGFGVLTTTPLVTPGFGLSRLRWGGSSCRCYSWGSL